MIISDKITKTFEVGGIEIFSVNSDGIIICDGGIEIDIDSDAKLLFGKIFVEVYYDDFTHISILPIKSSVVEVDGIRYFLKYKSDKTLDMIKKSKRNKRVFEFDIHAGCIVKNFSSKKVNIIKKAFANLLIKKYKKNF